MSVACDQQHLGSDNDEVAQAVTRSRSNDKDSFEEEELDYEEEMEYTKSNNSAKNEEEGEISDDDGQIEISQPTSETKAKTPPEKDEGELDDDDLEEGEVKEEEECDDDGEIEDTEPAPSKVEVDNNIINERPRIMVPSSQDPRTVTKYDRHGNPYISITSSRDSHWSNSNQNYSNSRYRERNDRGYSNSRSREHNTPPVHLQPIAQPTPESAWERGIKQARELITKASKRKEEDVDFDNKRFNMTAENTPQLVLLPENPVKSSSLRETRSPPKRRRHSSQHSSSEDEVERRHRLAYDAAPWNNNSSNYQVQSSGNYRGSRPNYSSSRTAEAYRDPWRRSKSPRPSANRGGGNGQRLDVDSRYGEVLKRERPSSKNADGGRRSNSMSSLSSIISNTSDVSPTDKSPGRKLPYMRPTLETKSRYDRETDAPLRNEPYPKSRMDRIPKKSNALAHNQSHDRFSDTKSFDSWSESLSDSDSSSFYSNSDSSDESDADTSARNKSAPNRAAKKLSASKRSQKNTKQPDTLSQSSSSRGSKQSAGIDGSKIQAGVGGAGGKSARSLAEKEAKKPPIKMVFTKIQAPLKKDRLIDEQLNGAGVAEVPVELVEGTRSSGSLSSMGSESDDENSRAQLQHALQQESASSSAPPGSNKLDRREELLMKLRAVEEAIERKLNAGKS